MGLSKNDLKVFLSFSFDLCFAHDICYRESQRLIRVKITEAGQVTKLDIWEVNVRATEEGFIQPAGSDDKKKHIAHRMLAFLV